MDTDAHKLSIFSSMKTLVLPDTVNVTGETLVQNEDFPSTKQGFFQHKAG